MELNEKSCEKVHNESLENMAVEKVHTDSDLLLSQQSLVEHLMLIPCSRELQNKWASWILKLLGNNGCVKQQAVFYPISTGLEPGAHLASHLETLTEAFP